jgi:antitoxin (DNA-binding transcriptional repressor) of toxin-antitoxin stability system
MKSLSIAKASSNFKHWVDRVCRTGESYEVVDEGIPCARLVPVPHANNAHEVADDLEAAALDRKRSPEPIGISAITYSELRVGIEAEKKSGSSQKEAALVLQGASTNGNRAFRLTRGVDTCSGLGSIG